MEINKIYQGDSLQVLKTFPDEFVDTIITSCPYWELRDYGIKGQIGLEPTLEEYLNKLLKITSELRRVLKPTGVMFWNHGDCYYSTPAGNKQYKYFDDGLYQRLGKRHTQGGKDRNTPKVLAGVPKCLALQNWRLILRMIDEQDWILRNTIIWHKPNHMPSSVKDRFANSYEPVFMLVKNKKYYFDLDAVRVPHTVCGVTDKRPMGILRQKLYPKSGYNKSNDPHLAQYQTSKYAKGSEFVKKYGEPWDRFHKWDKNKRNIDPRGNDKGGPGSWRVFKEDNPSFTNPKGKNPGDLWTIPTQPFPDAHFATFPEKLVEPMIKAGCPEKGIVLEPFLGSGTTAVVARKLGRNWIGIELSKEYIKIAEKRLQQQTLGI